MLSAKQKRFVEELLVDMNAAAAARRAGYSERAARQKGWELLQNPEVQKAVQAAREEQQKRTEITADYVLTRLQTIVERCMEEDWDPAQANRSLELLGKHLKMWTDKSETNLSGGLNIKWEE